MYRPIHGNEELTCMAPVENGPVDVEQLRERERLRRAERALARARGELPPLDAERRAGKTARILAPPAAPPVAVFSHARPSATAAIPARLVAVLQRLATDVGDSDVFGDLGSATDEPRLVDVVSCIELLPPLHGVEYLIELTHAGLPVLDTGTLTRAEGLTAGRADFDGVESTSAWALFTAWLAARGGEALPTWACLRLAGELPLNLLDDLVEADWLHPDDARTLVQKGTEALPADRAVYLTARIAPALLSDTDVADLGWDDETRRRRFTSGERLAPPSEGHDTWSILSSFRDGETSVLRSEPTAALRPGVADLVGRLRRCTSNCSVLSDLAADKGLWGLLEKLLPPGQVLSADSEFTAWAAVRRMYRILADAHVDALLAADGGAAAFGAASVQAMALRSESTRWWQQRADREARCVQAYLGYLDATSDNGERLRHAKTQLDQIRPKRRPRERPGRQRGAPPEYLARVSANVDLLDHLQHVGRPRDVLNPYLALGVPHDSDASDWRSAWRFLRQTVPTEWIEEINAAKDRIQRREDARRKNESAPELYAFPLEPFRWRAPSVVSPWFRPQAEPLRRRSGVSTGADVRRLAEDAAHEIIHEAAQRCAP
ncbi:hypothetical protein [Yinghuangia aomiensis]|uniref:hypothetical protein n=1 Tax=Yinghuangia aomiensis TaxID=676205 RepID=UPI0031E5DE83